MKGDVAFEPIKETESVMKLVEMSAGYWLPRVLHVIADLGVADALDKTPRSVDERAKDADADPDSLDRFAAPARFSRGL